MHQDLLVHRARVPEAHRCRPGRRALPDRFLVDAPSEGADKLAGLASKIEGGNYSVYICYIVAALVVFLVLAVVMV